MNTYTEMNEKIVGLLGLSDEPMHLYAAQRIKELEQQVAQFQHPVPDEAGEVYSRKQLEDAHIVGYTKGRLAEQDSDSIYQDAVNYAATISTAPPSGEDAVRLLKKCKSALGVLSTMCGINDLPLGKKAANEILKEIIDFLPSGNIEECLREAPKP